MFDKTLFNKTMFLKTILVKTMLGKTKIHKILFVKTMLLKTTFVEINLTKSCLSRPYLSRPCFTRVARGQKCSKSFCLNQNLRVPLKMQVKKFRKYHREVQIQRSKSPALYRSFLEPLKTITIQKQTLRF